VPWNLIGIGALAGAALVALDEVLGAAKRLRLPPLAVGIGIYLPAETIVPVVIGAVLGHVYDRYATRTRTPDRTKRLGVLLASGLIVGESLFGVLLAAIIVATGNGTPLAVVGASFEGAGNVLGTLAFVAITAVLYGSIARSSSAATP
jgi:uncharacterized oligopeptide transporter (OPT) family protein